MASPDMELFESHEITYDKCPIVMIDNSGSTSGWVLMTEMKKAQELLTHRGIKECYFMLWNSTTEYPNKKDITFVNDITSIKCHSTGGTNVTTGWKSLPDGWLAAADDIYVFTDGEIGDNKNTFVECIQNFFANKKKLYIVTVEDNNYNYLTDDVSAGNNIFKNISDSNLSHMIKQFICYNKFYTDTKQPFVNNSNPDVGPNMAAFREKLFRVDKTHLFIQHIENLINEIKMNGMTEEEKNNLYLKLSYDITSTLYFITRDRPLSTKRHIINLFCELFIDVGMYKTIRTMLLNEVDNVAKGKATTFQGYKNNREKVFEKAQIALYNNTKQAITNIPQTNYISFLMGTNMGDMIFCDDETNITHQLTLNDKTFNQSCIKIGNHFVPMIPQKITMDHDEYDQCVRQWLRANYSKKYHLNPASDMILYCFFADALRVFLSDVPEHIKNCYRELVRLNMDRKRFGTELSEYVYLMNNPPAPVKGNPNYIKYLLYRALKHGQFNDIEEVTAIEEDVEDIETGDTCVPTETIDGMIISDANSGMIKPFTFWYAFIKSMGDNDLIKAQLPYCIDDMKQNNVTEDNVIDFVKSKLSPVKHYIRNNKMIEYDYKCYITLEDTTETGGYIIPPHKLTANITCAPRFILSKDGYDALEDNISCPICYKMVKRNEFTKHPTMAEYIDKFNKLENINEPIVTDIIYDNKSVEIVNIVEDEYKKDDDMTLKPFDKCDFNVISYKINAPYLQEAVSGRSVEIKSQEEFNNIVFKRYPFLKDLDMTGVCLAGGFCRSIMLRQRVKDLDFFMYGNNHNVNFSRVLNDIISRLKLINPKYKFLMMYKHLFNVFEVVVVTDPNDFFKDDYKLDNYKQYQFKSLHRFDMYTIIDPETGKIYRKNNKSKFTRPKEIDIEDAKIENKDFSNYFEDGDVTGIRMCYRLQFILTRNNSIENIFENFDMYPCRVAWNGKETLFTDKSEKAFKYMINIVNENNYSDLYNHRLGKYFSYGFSIVLPRLNMEKLNKKPFFRIEKLSFKINNISENHIMVEHNSHITDKLKSIEALEKKSMKKGKALYKSSMFCSLVSLLRYVKINDVSYRFTSDVIVPKDDGFMEFREKNETVQFIDKIESRIPGHDWYKEMGVGYVKPSEIEEPVKVNINVTNYSESEESESEDDLDQNISP